MSFSNPYAAKTDDVSTIAAAETNAAGAAIAQAVDGAAGGTYTPSAKVEVNGSGLEVGGPFVLDAASDQSAQIDSTVAPTASSRRLMVRVPVHTSSTYRARLYASVENQVGLEIATNCVWSGTQWTADQAISSNILATFGLGKLSLQSQSTPGAPWTTWDRTLHLDPRTVTTPAANTLYPANVPKAWGRATTDGAGGITLNADFGCTSIALSSGDAVITLDNAMASTSYAVVAMSGDISNMDFVVGGPTTTTTCTVRMVRINAGAHAQRDLAATARTFSFVVFGLHA